MYQLVMIVGKVKNEQIELRYTGDGKPIANLNVSTYRKYTDSGGTSVYENTYFRVSVFGKVAENCQKFLHKDSLVLVVGRLSPDKQTGSPRIYTKNDGMAGTSYELYASEVRFLDTKSDTTVTKQEEPEPEF
jgi:single-strand DNA-binding protein